jgi:hypothetical protein
MKLIFSNFLFATLLSLFAPLGVHGTLWAKQMTYYTCSWQELQQIALYQQKPIFVEVYSSDNEVSKSINGLLSDTAISNYYNANFVNYRVDISSKLGDEFRQKYHVNNAPEILYFDSEGDLMYRKMGNRSKEEILHYAQLALSRSMLTLDVMQQQYDKGYRATAFLYDYAYKLQKKQMANAQVVNDYINKKRLSKQITKAEDLQFVYDFANNPRTQAFALLCKHQALFEKKYTADIVQRRIEDIAMGNVLRAAHTHNEKLYTQTRKIVATSNLPNVQDLLLRMEATYFNTSAI